MEWLRIKNDKDSYFVIYLYHNIIVIIIIIFFLLNIRDYVLYRHVMRCLAAARPLSMIAIPYTESGVCMQMLGRIFT